jgi:hypothetical protein
MDDTEVPDATPQVPVTVFVALAAHAVYDGLAALLSS